MNYRFAFVTFTYPGIERFIPIFIESLKNQTDVMFDLIVHNDGLEDVGKYFSSCSFPIKIVESGKIDLFGMRIWTFNYCLNSGYTHLILGDSDDYFASNRVEVYRQLFKKYDMIVNDVSLVNLNGKIYESRVFSRRLYHHSTISYENIKDYNFIGFTNSGFSTEVLKEIDDYRTNLKIADWFFFSVLLFTGKSMVFSTDTVSFYRQHNGNIARLRYFNEDLDGKGLEYLREVKHYHYTALDNWKSKMVGQVGNNIKHQRLMKFWWEI
jgi:hypothetical protein